MLKRVADVRYGCVSNEIEKRIKAAEMWFLRRISRIGWDSYTTNEEVLLQADKKEKKVKKTIKKQKLQFLGHCMRKNGTEKIILTDSRKKGKRKAMNHIAPKNSRME